MSPQEEIRIGIIGCAGRMGRMLVREVIATEGCRLAGAAARPATPEIGRDAGSVAGLEVLGVQVKSPPVVMLAPVGAPGSRLKVSVSPASASVAVAVNVSVDCCCTV